MLETQTFRGVQKFKEISMQSEGQSWWEYNFFYAVGIRLVNETNDDSKEGDSEESPLLQIMATFNALYRADEKWIMTFWKLFPSKTSAIMCGLTGESLFSHLVRG